jgi:hypothetical protein
MKNLIYVLMLFCVAAVADSPQPTWKLTVNEPQELVTIDTDGKVTIRGDIHTRVFWERVAAAFKEDCPNTRSQFSPSLTTPYNIAPVIDWNNGFLGR